MILDYPYKMIPKLVSVSHTKRIGSRESLIQLSVHTIHFIVRIHDEVYVRRYVCDSSTRIRYA